MITYFRNFLLFIFFTIGIQELRAQEQGQRLPRSVTKLELLTPGVSKEWKFSSASTLRVKIATFSVVRSVILALDGSSNGLRSHFLPIIDTQYRYYYTFKKGSKIKLNVSDNSADYLALKLIAFIPSVVNNYEIENFYWVGPTWGMQEKLSDKICFDLAGGIGYLISQYDDNQIYPLVTINFSYQLNSSK